ncbi:MAG: hypothetical protein CL610_06920 [Anaerolineaceae bacterium]|nr:hypothetical protein [Anaerolineaceae bacterium]
MNIIRTMFRTLGFTLVFVSALQTPFVSAQEADTQGSARQIEPALRFAHVDSDDGLVQNTIEAILQDRNGFMWFATEGGLSRYDGYRFTTFQNQPGTPNSLTQNHINDLYEDRDGMIWIATEGGGINQLDPLTEQFKHYGGPRNAANTIRGDRHFKTFQDSRGRLWFGGTDIFGLTVYDPRAQETFTYMQDQADPAGFHGRGIEDIVETADQQLWIAARNTIVRFDMNGETFHNYNLRNFNESFLNTLQIDRQGTLWAGGSAGLYRFDPVSDRFRPFPDTRGVNDILEVNNGELWLATSQGLYRFDPTTEEIIGTEKSHAGISYSLQSDTLFELYESRSGLIWIGGDKGIDVYDPHRARFAFYPQLNSDNRPGLAEGEITAIEVKGDTAWIAVDSVLHHINLNTNQLTVYDLKDHTVNGSSITAITQDHTGIVWLADRRGRLFSFSPDTETFELFPLAAQPAEQNPPARPNGPAPGAEPSTGRITYIIALAEDDAHHLWMAFDRGGLVRLDAARETTMRYEPPPGPALRGPSPPGNGPFSPPFENMSVDRAGNLWLSNLNGFHRFDPVSETYQRFRLLSPQGTDVWTEASLEDRDGIIWIASREGLFRLNPETGDVRRFTTEDGLPSNYLVGILEDASGDLWSSSKKGLSRFTPSTETFHNYDRFDGLQGSEFSSHVFAQADDGRMFFGGTNGLTVFYPHQIAESSFQPPIILDDFELFNQSVVPGPDSVLSKPIWQTENLTLDHTQNVISFEFAVLNYAFEDKNSYRYRLEGFENQWNETDSDRRFATYTNLPAGSYTFSVQAANRDGVWSDNEVTLALKILPPWWETSWTRFFAVLAAASLILGGYHWRVRSIAQRNKELRRAVDRQTEALVMRTEELQASEAQLREAKEAADAANRAKSAFLANMSHELRSPLNAILGFAQISNRMPDLPVEIQENLGVILHSGEHLLDLINQVLDLSKIEAGQMALQARDFDLYAMLDNLEEMFMMAAENKHLSLKFECADNLPRYVRTDVTKLRQVLINLIGNAVKFTARGEVLVRVNKIADIDTVEVPQVRLGFEVSDTGSGIPAKELPHIFDAFTQTELAREMQEGTGLGLPISRKIVRLMGGDIHVSSVPGQGTSFSFAITCPVGSSSKSLPEHDQQPVIGLVPGQPRYRILIVDDKWTNRQLLVKLLAPLGFDLREADNGQDAITIARSFKPHMIWMDIRMPVMNGLEATRRLKALPEGDAIVIVALTASGYDEERAKILASGCDDMLSKPFRAADILEMMARKLNVQYVYDTVPAATSPAPKQLSPAETSEMLRSLPYELLVRWIESVELGDVQMIATITADVRDYDPVLADSLSQLVQRFEFDELLAILKEAI